jgi:hypothetical protein
MFLFDFLFGKREQPAATSAPTGPAAVKPDDQVAAGDAAAPGTTIHYHPDLIDKFVDDHRALLQRFTAVRTAAEAGDVAGAATVLDEFRAALQGHLLAENIRLYVYLEHALAGDADKHALVHAFRHEMDGIGKAVVAFLTKYRDLGTQPELAASFVADLDAVGEVLVERIRREEGTLYPLYVPRA